MKLALLSHQITHNSKTAIRLLTASIGQPQLSASYIGSEPDPQKHFFNEASAIYAELGIDLNLYLDFESGFQEDKFDKALENPIVHLSGGNTFRFLHHLKQRAATDKLQAYVKNGGAIIGVSAGAMLLTPHIASATLCGDENELALADLSALSLAPFLFVPHSSKGIEDIELANALAIKHKQTIYLASDEDAIVIHEDKMELVGSPLKINNKSVA